MAMKKIKEILSGHKRLVIILLVGLVGLGGWFFWGRRNNTTPQYQTSAVSRGTVISAISASGQVVTSGRMPILSAASGQVKQVLVKNGDRVTAGQKILEVTLDPTAAQKSAAALSSYLAARDKINSLQSALFKANQAFVNDKGVSNPSDTQKTDPKYVEENADWLQAEADYKNQQVAVAAAWLAYQQLSPDLVAPVSGTVSDLTYIPGMLISGAVSSGIAQSQTIATVVSDSEPIVAVNLSEVDVNKVHESDKVTLTFDALVDKTFTGRVMGINKTGVVSSGVTNYPAIIKLDTKVPEILPNMSVSTNIILASKQDVLLVPSEAVQTQNGQSSVRVLKNGQAQTVNVETGLSSDTQIEITSGLNEGDEVITGTAATSATPTGTSPFSTFRVGGGGFGGGARGGGGGR